MVFLICWDCEGSKTSGPGRGRALAQKAGMVRVPGVPVLRWVKGALASLRTAQLLEQTYVFRRKSSLSSRFRRILWTLCLRDSYWALAGIFLSFIHSLSHSLDKERYGDFMTCPVRQHRNPPMQLPPGSSYSGFAKNKSNFHFICLMACIFFLDLFIFGLNHAIIRSFNSHGMRWVPPCSTRSQLLSSRKGSQPGISFLKFGMMV